MDVVKYFYEEPASLEVLAPDLDPDARRQAARPHPAADWLDAPRYYRGYLAGTDLAAGRVGLTAIAHPEAFIAPLLDAFSTSRWTLRTTDGAVHRPSLDDVEAVLRDPTDVTLLACADAPLPADALDVAATTDRRRALDVLRPLLGHARVVLFPEPAHHGCDWSLFAAHPMCDALTDAFRRHPHPHVRRYAIPVRKARSEHTFYFETHDPDRFSVYEIGGKGEER